ncbi:MAG TPA: carboxypeptidase-like regulatory domain-containing protein, partial [Terriglobia bacterium]|nr:carboxypeptidase-like regulatory domain-containing protein [Terriglobia bacterium]
MRKSMLAAGTLGVLMFCLPAFPQAELCRILGSVADSTGAVIPGAAITITDVQRGISRTLTVDEVGQYVAPGLLAGTYTVRVEFPGFKTIERQNVVLEVGQNVRIDLVLQPGQAADTITVTEAVPVINTTDA